MAEIEPDIEIRSVNSQKFIYIEKDEVKSQTASPYLHTEFDSYSLAPSPSSSATAFILPDYLHSDPVKFPQIYKKINMTSSVGTGILSVKDSLELVSISDSLRELIANSAGTWIDFGKKNSSILRTKLFRIIREEKLSQDAVFMLYFLHAAVKDCERILQHMDTLPSDMKSQAWFNEVKTFITKRLVKYVRAETSRTFASVHLPNTNPGLDILCFLLQQKPPTSMIETQSIMNSVIARTTFTQMNVDDNLLAENKEYVREFWDKTIVYKDAADRVKNKREIGFQETYWETQSKDKYAFLTKNLREYNDKPLNKNSLGIYILRVYDLWDERAKKPKFMTETSKAGATSFEGEKEGEGQEIRF